MISKKEWLFWFAFFGLAIIFTGVMIGVPISILVSYIATHNDKERFRSIIGTNRQLLSAMTFLIISFVIVLII